jgi:acetyl esterase/lipase
MKITRCISLVFLLVVMYNTSFGQQQMSLYPGKIPNSKPNTVIEKTEDLGNGVLFISDTSIPTLTAYLPDAGKSNGTAVIICPGGGYSGVAILHEGYQVAEAFQKMGVAAFVLKNRTPSEKTMVDKSIGPLQDAQRAIQLVRQKAKDWHIDTGKVGILGFSAGAHLAATAGSHFNHPFIENKSGINLRPDFMILAYPVISFTDSLTHMGSRENLIGKNPPKEQIIFFSNELQVGKQTPPVFLVQAGDDDAVKVENSISFYRALHQNGIEAELLIYPKGGHGFGMINPTTSDKWMEACEKWMQSNGWLSKNKTIAD